MKNPKKILVIIQRSNGDVFLSTALIKSLFNFYNNPQIDLLVNDDTFSVAKLLPNIAQIHQFSYFKKKNSRWTQEKKLLSGIFRKYDLSINLTSSDRSVFYACIASNYSISAIEKNQVKSWWKKFLLSKYYFFDTTRHILLNNLEPLNILNINHQRTQESISISKSTIDIVKNKLLQKGINSFIIFHPSAQYEYKIYPEKLRNELLADLNTLGIPIIVSGSNNVIDLAIKNTLPRLENIIDWIGETSIEEYFSLSELSLAYIGMDTLNMHIAAAQDKPIFAIFGPTNLKMWAPWSNDLKSSASIDMPVQKYSNITIFQADIPCVACGYSGCNNNGVKSDCLDKISPKLIFNKFKEWLDSQN